MSENNKSRLFTPRNFFQKENSTISTRDVSLFKTNKPSQTKVIPLKTTGVRIPGNHRRESYILQTDLEEVRGPIQLKRFTGITRDSQFGASPGLRRSKITPSIHEKKSNHQNDFEMTSMKSTSLNERSEKDSDSENKPKTSILLKISVIVSLIGLCCHSAAISLTMWMSSEFSTIGLWELCIVQICGRYKSVTPEMQAGQAMNVLGLLAGGAAVVLIILYIFCLTTYKTVRLVGMIASFVAACFIVIGVIVIGTSDYSKVYDVGWAMIMAIIGALLYIATGVFMVIQNATHQT